MKYLFLFTIMLMQSQAFSMVDKDNALIHEQPINESLIEKCLSTLRPEYEGFYSCEVFSTTSSVEWIDYSSIKNPMKLMRLVETIDQQYTPCETNTAKVFKTKEKKELRIVFDVYDNPQEEEIAECVVGQFAKLEGSHPYHQEFFVVTEK